jgi:frataxin-like iron-binding protein CyaY
MLVLQNNQHWLSSPGGDVSFDNNNQHWLSSPGGDVSFDNQIHFFRNF